MKIFISGVIYLQERVKDLMSRNVVALLPSDTVEEAAKLMYEYDIGALPIVSGGELKGMLTDRDIVLRCVAGGKDAEKMKVSELMTQDILFVTPDQTIHDAVNMMSSAQIRRLPVVENGAINGMLSLADIARKHAGPEIASAISEISESSIGPSNAIKTK